MRAEGIMDVFKLEQCVGLGSEKPETGLELSFDAGPTEFGLSFFDAPNDDQRSQGAFSDGPASGSEASPQAPTPPHPLKQG